MSRRYLLPILALGGLLIAVAVIVQNNRAAPIAPPPIRPPVPPFDSYVAGSGLVEASTGNIVVGTPVAGLVTDISVAVGDTVQAGQPLFKIDDRDLRAELLTARAKVEEADATLQKNRHELAYSENLGKEDPQALSEQQLTVLRDQVAVARAALNRAQVEVERLQLEIRRRTVRAPVAGRVLQRKLRLGEYVEASESAEPMLILGDTKRFHVRVEVDQQDAWRVRPGAAAIAFDRGNPQLRIPLDFAYIEPLIVPKRNLTGGPTERTDTRVLEVLYGFSRGERPVYAGQQLDVYIQAPPVTAANTER